ncbi:MAG TPA: hypothetical protein VGF24_06855 [Vicinamibacterales bacterium]|jgi:hypothetical protein
MSDVLGVAALEIGNPVLLLVLMESNDAALHDIASPLKNVFKGTRAWSSSRPAHDELAPSSFNPWWGVAQHRGIGGTV